MNTHGPSDPWQRLCRASRQSESGAASAAPYGFATRVVALAFERSPGVRSVFERFALRAVAAACLLALASAGLNYRALFPVEPVSAAVEHVSLDDPLGELLDA